MAKINLYLLIFVLVLLVAQALLAISFILGFKTPTKGAIKSTLCAETYSIPLLAYSSFT